MAARNTEIVGQSRNDIEVHKDNKGKTYIKIKFIRLKARKFVSDSYCIIIGDEEVAFVLAYLAVFDRCEKDGATRLWRKVTGPPEDLRIGKQVLGKNTCAAITVEIARLLGLPNPGVHSVRDFAAI